MRWWSTAWRIARHPRPRNDAQGQRLGDVAGGLALGQLEEHLELALGQLLVRRPAFLAIELLRQQFGHGRGDVAPAQRDGADRVDDLHRLAFLVEVATGALADQVHRIVFFGIARQDQDADVRRLGADHSERVDPTLSRHGQVHHQHIEFGRADQVDGLAAAGSFPDDPQVDLFGEKLLQPRPHDGMVIHNSDSDHVWFSFAMTSTGPFV